MKNLTIIMGALSLTMCRKQSLLLWKLPVDRKSEFWTHKFIFFRNVCYSCFKKKDKVELRPVGGRFQKGFAESSKTRSESVYKVGSIFAVEHLLMHLSVIFTMLPSTSDKKQNLHYQDKRIYD